MGYRGRGRGAYPGNGPFSDLPPWQRPGWVYGFGRGWSGAGGDPYACQRFPWLPRWWAAPDLRSGTAFAPPTQERSLIERSISMAEEYLEAMRKRLEELDRASRPQ